MDEFSGKVALITGAGRGIGREVARALATLGVAIAANDINPTNLDETVTQIEHQGGKAQGYLFDIAKRMPVEGMVSQVLDHFGRIDILINQARVRPDAAFLDMDEWEYHRTLDVNLAGPYFCIQQVGRAMRQGEGGVIVNLACFPEWSSFARGHSAYFISQAGLLGLASTVAGELAQYHIRIYTLYSGSQAQQSFSARRVQAEALAQWKETLPQLPPGEHPDLVSLVLFLCSASAPESGQVICADMEI